jgi:hypothetical protein
MAAPVVGAAIATAKFASFIKTHWKKIIIAVFFIALFPVIMASAVVNAFLPQVKQDKAAIYQSVAKDADLDWLEMLSYDTAKFNNQFSKSDVIKTSFSFIKVEYNVYRWVETTSSSGSKSREKVLIEHKESTDFESTRSLLNYVNDVVKNRFNTSDNNMKVEKVKQFIDRIDFVYEKDEKDIEREAKYSKVPFDEVINNLDSNHKEWAINVLGHFLLKYDKFKGISDFFNPEGQYMANIQLDASKYKVADASKWLNGDTDVNAIFAGRIAFIAEQYNQKVTITSGYRSIQEQQAIWDSTPPERRGIYVAAPGSSRHQYGIAADITGFILNLSNAELEVYGLYKPMSYENWHIEPVETRIGGN